MDFYGSLEEVFNTQIKIYGFLFIHKFFIVNYSYVAIFEYERVILSDNTVLSIGQSKRKEIRKIQNELKKKKTPFYLYFLSFLLYLIIVNASIYAHEKEYYYNSS